MDGRCVELVSTLAQPFLLAVLTRVLPHIATDMASTDWTAWNGRYLVAMFRCCAVLVPTLLFTVSVHAQLILTDPRSKALENGQGLGPLWTPTFSQQELLRLDTPWNYQQLGLFCKLDVQLERGLRIPVVFRLGDVQRVEAMEGKGPLREVELH